MALRKSNVLTQNDHEQWWRLAGDLEDVSSGMGDYLSTKTLLSAGTMDGHEGIYMSFLETSESDRSMLVP